MRTHHHNLCILIVSFSVLCPITWFHIMLWNNKKPYSKPVILVLPEKCWIILLLPPIHSGSGHTSHRIITVLHKSHEPSALCTPPPLYVWVEGILNWIPVSYFGLFPHSGYNKLGFARCRNHRKSQPTLSKDRKFQASQMSYNQGVYTACVNQWSVGYFMCYYAFLYCNLCCGPSTPWIQTAKDLALCYEGMK